MIFKGSFPFTVFKKYWLIPHVVQYTLEPTVYPIVWSSLIACPTPQLVTTGLCSLSVRLLIFCYIYKLVVFLDSKYKQYYRVFVFLCLTFSLSITLSKSIYVAANGKNLSSYGWVLFYCVCIHHILFINSSIDGHVGFLHILAIVNNATVNIAVHVSFQINVFTFLDIDPRVELFDHVLALFLVFWETSIPFSTVATPIYIHTHSVWGFPFFYIFTNICYLCSFWL